MANPRDLPPEVLKAQMAVAEAELVRMNLVCGGFSKEQAERIASHCEQLIAEGRYPYGTGPHVPPERRCRCDICRFRVVPANKFADGNPVRNLMTELFFDFDGDDDQADACANDQRDDDADSEAER